MAEPLTPRARQIVAVARELLEEDGVEGLTMRRLAARLGIRAPSLYKQLPNKAAFAFAHGMVMLELTKRLPPDADPEVAWQEGIAAFLARATSRPSEHAIAEQPQ